MLPPTYVEGFHDPEVVKKMMYRELGKTGMKVTSLPRPSFRHSWGWYACAERVMSLVPQVSLLSLGASSLGSVFRGERRFPSVAFIA